jgi:hypothetical protein
LAADEVSISTTIQQQNVIPRAVRWAAVATAIFLVSFATGHLFAEANIPNYDSKEAALIFFVANVRPYFDKDTIRLSLLTPTKQYSYSSSGNDRVMVDTRNQSPSPIKRWKMFELERASDVLALSAVPSSGGLFEMIAKGIKLEKYPALERTSIVVFAALTAASGGIVGYYSTYSDPEDYDSPSFQEVLRDPNSWRPFIDNIQKCGIHVMGEPLIRDEDYSYLTMKSYTAECQKLMKWIRAKPASWWG